MKQTIIRTGLNSLYFSGMHHVTRPLLGGVGTILTLHHVRPPRSTRFQPNRLLEVSPGFFEGLLKRLRRSRRDLISLDEMHQRMVSGTFKRRFVCVTFDDGYRDVLEYGYPLLRKYEVPFAMYIPTSFPDRIGELWWVALEMVIAKSTRIGLSINGKDKFFDCNSASEKRLLFNDVYTWLRNMKSEAELRKVVRDLAARQGLDIHDICKELCMGWEEINQLAADPLCTIGAHTVNHVMLKKLDREQAVRAEMDMSRSIIEAALGRRPQHLAYPVGDSTSAGPREFRIAAELGFKTAVTTRPGVVFKAHREHMTALPRISVNGDFQNQRYLKVLMSGAATAMWNGFRRVNAA